MKNKRDIFPISRASFACLSRIILNANNNRIEHNSDVDSRINEATNIREEKKYTTNSQKLWQFQLVSKWIVKSFNRWY